MSSNYQYLRKATLLVANEDQVMDLSELKFRFEVKSAEVESPNNSWIRVYNLSDQTIARIRNQYERVILSAGYGDNVGVIFDGVIKQFRIGREDSKTTYFDILAADGDIAYNNAVINRTLSAGSTLGDRIAANVATMRATGDVKGVQVLMNETGGVLPRGKVLFGMSRLHMRQEAESVGATWSIQNGIVQVIPRNSYKPDQVVVLNGQTGLIGRPEQTVDGIRARCLINPTISVGARVQIDNDAINQTVRKDANSAPVPYDQWAALQFLANTSMDGIYRVYVIEYQGDTRGQEFYADLTLLAIDASTEKVISP